MRQTKLTNAERAFVLGYCYEVLEARDEECLANQWLRGQGAGGAEIAPLVRVLYDEENMPPNKLPPKPNHYESPWKDLEALRARVKELKRPRP